MKIKKETKNMKMKNDMKKTTKKENENEHEIWKQKNEKT